MKVEAAIKEMKKIERIIKKLNKHGCSVRCVESTRLVLETPHTSCKNGTAMDEAALNMRNHDGGATFNPEFNFDYEIIIE